MPIGGASAGEGLPCSLRSRLFFNISMNENTLTDYLFLGFCVNGDIYFLKTLTMYILSFSSTAAGCVCLFLVVLVFDFATN